MDYRHWISGGTVYRPFRFMTLRFILSLLVISVLFPSLVSAVVVSPLSGPLAGGTLVTISNTAAMGSGTDISSVSLGGVSAGIQAQGTTWVRILSPVSASAGVKSIVVQSATIGTTTFTGAFTYNPQGSILTDVAESWSTVSSIPVNRCSSALVAYNGALYSVGGTYYPGSFSPNSAVYRFDGSSWSSVTSLPVIRYGLAGAVIQSNLYVIGGYDGAGGTSTNTYLFNGSTWTSSVAFSGLGRAMLAASSFRGSIHIMGGYYYNQASGTSSGWFYNTPRFDGTNWVDAGALPLSRHYLGSGVADNMLYAVGGRDDSGTKTNVWQYNGSTWQEVAGLPEPRQQLGVASVDDELFAMGGADASGVAKTNVYRFDGSTWTEVLGMPEARMALSVCEMNGYVYVVGGAQYINEYGHTAVYRYQPRERGVFPAGGAAVGGYRVTIKGVNLGNGSDITNVTLCGVSASIITQTASRVVVTANAALWAGCGDVAVYSTSYGKAVKNQAFTYEGPGLKIGNTQGCFLVSGEAASAAKSTQFGAHPSGTGTVNTFTITNSGTESLYLTGWSMNGSQASAFQITGWQTGLTAGAVNSFSITFTPSAVGNYTASLRMTNNSHISPFIVSLAGSCFSLSTNTGPFAGGNSVTVTAGTIGNGSDITNVTVGGVSAVIQAQGSAWVRIVLPAAASAGVKDVVAQSSSVGNTLFAGAYTYNQAGQISTISPSSGSVTGGYPVTISGSNLGNGTDITNVMLCGRSATILTQSISNVVVTANPAYYAGIGSAMVYSTSHGLTMAIGFRYTQPNLTVLGTNGVELASGTAASTNGTAFGSCPWGGAVTNRLSITNSGTQVLTVSGVSTSGSVAAFRTIGIPTQVASGSVSNFYVVFQPPGVASYSAAVTMANDSTTTSYIVNFTGTGVKNAQAITFAVATTNVLTTNRVNLSATASSGLPVSLSVSDGPGVLTGGTNLSFIGSGTVSITASQSGNTNWNAATSVTRVFHVNRASQSALTFGPFGPWAYQTTNVLSTSGGSGTGAVIYVVVSGPGSIVNTSKLAMNSGSGMVVVSAIKATDAMYNAIAAVTTVLCSRASQTITFAVATTNVLTTNTVNLSAASSSGLAVSFVVSSGPGAVTDGTNLSFTGAGSVSVTAYQPGNTNWNAATSVTRVFNVSRTKQSALTFGPFGPWTYQTTNALSVSGGSGTGAVTYAVVSGPGNLVDETNLVMNSGSGMVVVTVSKAMDAIYSANMSTATVACALKTQAITFTEIGLVHQSASVGLEASASSALPVALDVLSGPGLLSGTNLTFTAAGAVLVKASQAGNVYYAAAPAVTNRIRVWNVSTNNGPLAGGNSLTLTVGALGSGVDITNVTVGGVSAVIEDQGTDWVRLLLPATGEAGSKDIRVQTVSIGEFLFPAAYAYNESGRICGARGWTVLNGHPITSYSITAGVLGDRLYSCGGLYSPPFGEMTNVYSFDGQTWSAEPGLPSASGTLIASGYKNRLYVMRSANNSWITSNDCYSFDGTAWSEAPGLSNGLADQCIGELNGSLYCVGGSITLHPDLYTYTSVAQTNVFRFNGTNWMADVGLPEPLHYHAMAVLNGRLYVAGGYNLDYSALNTNLYGFDGTNWSVAGGMPPGMAGHFEMATLNGGLYVLRNGDTNVFRYDGAGWTTVESLPDAISVEMITLRGAIYAIGCGSTTVTNLYRYDDGLADNVVIPNSGNQGGGYTVVINGQNLGNGSDITNVSLCGLKAAIISQSTTQVVVVASASAVSGAGDVRVDSVSYGTTVKAGAFAYTQPGMQVLGTNGEIIASGAAASLAEGTAFGPLATGASETRTFVITNNGTEALIISGVSTSGATVFQAANLPTQIAAGAVSNVTITFQPVSVGDYAASLRITNNSTTAVYTMNLSGSSFGVSTNIGPSSGGNVLTITGGAMGSGSDITNVTVGGVQAIIEAQGATWVRIVLPAVSETGQKDVVVQSAGMGTTTFPDAYTYNPAGMILNALYPLPAKITMSGHWLNGDNGVIFEGAYAGDFSGYSVSSAGDVNGDGYDDFLLGVPDADSSSLVGAGATCLVYGRSNGLPASVSLSDSWLDGTNGVCLSGSSAQYHVGYSVSSAGDVNGDGFADLLLGAFQASSYAGETYLVYGRPGGLPAQITLNSRWLDGTNGVLLAGAGGGIWSGHSVSSAGDVNGDGLSDFLIGAHYAAPSGVSYAGETYLVYGRSNGLPALITLSASWLDGANGVILAGADAMDQSGWSVSSAGDVNGDGLSDLLLGGYTAEPSGLEYAGKTCLVYGQSNGLPAYVTLSDSWLNGVNGVRLVGNEAQDWSGHSVSSAGDVNGDGLSDLLVGAYRAAAGDCLFAGQTYLVYGRLNGLPATIPLVDSWFDGTNGVLLGGAEVQDSSGYSVSSAGDVNGDGWTDLLVGANNADSPGLYDVGKTFLVYGHSNGLPAQITLTDSWLDGTNGVCLVGANAGYYIGSSVSSAGDVNGDGLSDLLVGSYAASPSGRSAAGETYLIYGRSATATIPVDPPSGSRSGGYPVTIRGLNLGNGSDITSVTLCGIPVSGMISQSATQVIVIAGAATVPGAGNVQVVSASYGTVVKSNAFTYTQPGMQVLGTNGQVIASGEAATPVKGTVFGPFSVGSSVTRTLTITNNGTEMLTVSGIGLCGAGTGVFHTAVSMVQVDIGAVQSISITFQPVSAGDFTASLCLTNDSATVGYMVNLSGFCFAFSTNIGPSAGGNVLTITGGTMGSGSDITNVMVGGVPATIQSQGTDWVVIVLPEAGTVGMKDITVQSTSIGSTTFSRAYTYNPPGVIPDSSYPLPALIMLSNEWLDGVSGAILAGSAAYASSGYSVSSAGDMNGDGYADMLLGAPMASPQDRTYAGETYLVYGRSNGIPLLNNLNSDWLDGTNGVIFAGAVTYMESGHSVSSAGDVNGDGYDDILVGAYKASPSGCASAGEAYLVYGRSDGLPSWIMLNSTWLDGTNGVRLVGAMTDAQSGYSVSTAGDVNGDGYADILIGANQASPDGRTYAGESYLVYGTSNGLPSLITLSSVWLDGTNGVLFAGSAAYNRSGNAVSSAGDVNGDGFADILIGAYLAGPSGRMYAGETYLVYGRSSGLPARVMLSSAWLDGVNGVILAGAAAEYYCGSSVSSAGDVNGDGYADLLVSAFGADPAGRTDAGEAYLIYGRSSGLPAQIMMSSTWLDGANGVLFTGAGQYDYAGSSVSSAGDVNGDGFADMLIGVSHARPSGLSMAGETYLIYGCSAGWSSTINLENGWPDGTNGVLLAGAEAGDHSGSSVSSAGDVNGDGFADILIGAEYADSTEGADAGETYVIYGRSTNTFVSVGPSIAHWAGGDVVTISGINLGDGGDITNVTLCGVPVAEIVSQSPTQVVVVAGGTSAGGTGNVTVYSISYGVSEKIDGFEYEPPEYFQVDVVAGAHGSVDVASGLKPAGGVLMVSALPDTYYDFLCWTGDVSSEQSTNSELQLLIDAPKSIVALFTERVTSETATPEWWLAQYGWTNNLEATADQDADQDGMPTWQEYIAGTSPVQANSRLVTELTEQAEGTVLTWPSVSGRVYSVYFSTNLITGMFEVMSGASGLSATPDWNSYTNTTVTNTETIFYRIGVSR